MVEVPAAALMAEAFAPHVDFFSVGTNDLAQYVLAAERGNAEVAALADALHPAVLRLIHDTDARSRRARTAGRRLRRAGRRPRRPSHCCSGWASPSSRWRRLGSRPRSRRSAPPTTTRRGSSPGAPSRPSRPPTCGASVPERPDSLTRSARAAPARRPRERCPDPQPRVSPTRGRDDRAPARCGPGVSLT